MVQATPTPEYVRSGNDEKRAVSDVRHDRGMRSATHAADPAPPNFANPWSTSPAANSVASTSGETPNTFDAQADHVATFSAVLGLSQVDVLGFSIGGYVAQTFTLRYPESVRRLILVGTAPRGGETEGTHPDVSRVARNPVPDLEDFLFLFFEPSETSEAAGKAFWERRHQRTIDVDPSSSEQTMKAQTSAIVAWREQHGERYAELSHIQQPTLVVNGHHDIMVPTINSYILSERIPNAELIVYPNSGHGSLFQYPDLFVSHAARFLDTNVAFS